jgi:hypothetical protein
MESAKNATIHLDVSDGKISAVSGMRVGADLVEEGEGWRVRVCSKYDAVPLEGKAVALKRDTPPFTVKL